MKTKINILLPVMLIAVLCLNINCEKPKMETFPMNPTIQTIHQRKSVRSFTDDKVSDEILEQIVRAGMAAPTAVNKQPWAFIVINDSAALKGLKEALPYAKMINQAAIVVCGDMAKALTGMGQAFWVQDCSAASENILLAVESLGLGAVWTAVYPDQVRIDAVKKILNLPEHIIPLNVIPIGYPAKETEPKDKWKPENLHWQKW